MELVYEEREKVDAVGVHQETGGRHPGHQLISPHFLDYGENINLESTTASLPSEDEDDKYDFTIALGEVRGIRSRFSLSPCYLLLKMKASATETTDPSGLSLIPSPLTTPLPLSPDDMATRSGYQSRSNLYSLFYRRHSYANTSSLVFSTISFC